MRPIAELIVALVVASWLSTVTILLGSLAAEVERLGGLVVDSRARPPVEPGEVNGL